MEDYNTLARREEETIRLWAQAEAMVKAAQEGTEHLEWEKAAFKKLKQTERWAASAGLEQVRTLAKLLSDERKLWKESCARENEKFFRVRQELNNLKATNAALVKEKVIAEAAVKVAETRGATALNEAEAHAAKVLADADADRTKLNKAEVESRVTILEEIVETILDAPENTTAIAETNERARQAGFKARYNKCLSDVNPFCTKKFTDERSGFHGVDTEGAYDATVDACELMLFKANA
ncbi:hypothetical protein HanXRQr2_Chr01g0006581 [Helianthus annuus]|uniref:Uncharacterized protein n=1 Tax=Helianthus annuus TaxID=4232 RepID=A0A9K3P1T4_HELAN|nr:hypothetical protein HanXRQr2_Chr01g0006581 [Helianthus annuus]KAJ0610578.1 hypothetical protein HanHA300_Chr01g0005341 [Helianthus annuus]KAJ0621314.1 hypothetical protein HanIR_Chr01g0007281 [Helianthus annuus]KAJ0625828.1 hypothetical protein HanHA89_Chr01g0006031 [Helianthus annuus]KAJ0782187.1 hypothetical protein HanLR1_Chr01g0005271 [Helianthus annuus]